MMIFAGKVPAESERIREMANATKPETLGEKLLALKATVLPTFKAASEFVASIGEDDDEESAADKNAAAQKLVSDLRTKIVHLNSLASELRKQFDEVIDMRDAGMFGVDFAPEVERIRAKSENVGRPKTVKTDERVSLDI